MKMTYGEIPPDQAVKLERRELVIEFMNIDSEHNEAIRFGLTLEWYRKMKAHLAEYEKFYS